MIRILLAEDVRLVRGALATLLGLETDLNVVVAVARGDEIVPAAIEHRPDVAVLDIDLPGIDGITAAGELRAALPGCRVLMLTGLGRPGTLRRALQARVDGFLLKDATPARLSDAVRRVAGGHRVIDPDLALAAWDAPVNPLTDREIEILRLTATGADIDEVAGALHLSKGTVRNYLTSAVTKLNARNRVDAVRLAQDGGYLM